MWQSVAAPTSVTQPPQWDGSEFYNNEEKANEDAYQTDTHYL
jgi:hypothetical protein